MVVVKTCTCVSGYQDKRYGPGKRVWNECIKDGKRKGWTCTVCGKKQEVL